MRDRRSPSRATFRNTYPSRPAAIAASRATPDCGLDGRRAPHRCIGVDVAPHAATVGAQASSTSWSSTSAGYGRIDGMRRTPPHTRHTPTSTRRSPVFDPKTGHGGRRGAEYRPHEPRLPPRPFMEDPVPPSRKAAGSSSISRWRSSLTNEPPGQFPPTSAQTRDPATSAEVGSILAGANTGSVREQRRPSFQIRK